MRIRRTWLDRLASIGVEPSDPENLRIAKKVVTLTTLLIVSLSTVWVATYLALGLVTSDPVIRPPRT